MFSGLVFSRSDICAWWVLCTIWSTWLSPAAKLPQWLARQSRGWCHDWPNTATLQLCILCVTCAWKQVSVWLHFSCSYSCFYYGSALKNLVTLLSVTLLSIILLPIILMPVTLLLKMQLSISPLSIIQPSIILLSIILLLPIHVILLPITLLPIILLPITFMPITQLSIILLSIILLSIMLLSIILLSTTCLVIEIFDDYLNWFLSVFWYYSIGQMA